MINYLKNELKHLPFVILVVICLYGFKVFADSYALSSMEVSFDNTGTNIQATNMQSAINEVYQHATDYNEIKTTIGSSTLTTTDKTLTGAVNELNTNKVNTSAIANNLTTTTEGLVLDARQGKALNDSITLLAKKPVVGSSQASKAIGTSWTNTGFSVVIPKNSIFGIEAWQSYNNSYPSGVGINVNSSNFQDWSAVISTTNAATMSGYVSPSGDWTLRIWAKANSAGNNNVGFNWWYINLD